MIIIVCDILNSLLQSILIAWTCNCIVSKENRATRNKMLMIIIGIFAEVEVFTNMHINPPLSNLLMMLLVLISLLLFYRKSSIEVFLGFGISYLVILTVSYVVTTLYRVIIGNMSFGSETFKILLVIYIPAFLSYLVFYVLRREIFNYGIYLKKLKHSILIFQVIDYTLIFIGTMQGEWVTIKMTANIKQMLIGLFIIICLFEAIYFLDLTNKSKKVAIINDELVNKIIELKQIKKQYVDEMGVIYSTYQTGEYEKLGNIIKCAIVQRSPEAATMESNDKQNPIIAFVLNLAKSRDIEITVSDIADYKNLSVSENELIKVLSNIVKNSIDAVEKVENPNIKFSSNNDCNGVTIIIQNNGPRIPNEIIKKIFDTGFSTKANTSNDRGFGLSIVKEIINRCGGRIRVESDDKWTQFKIEIPFAIVQ